MQLLTSSIRLNDICFYAYHGVSAMEKKVGCKFRINLELDCHIASESYIHDNLDGTVDYGKVYETAKKAFLPTCNLLEHAAWLTGEALLQAFPLITCVHIEVEKLDPPIGGECKRASVALTLTR